MTSTVKCRDCIISFFSLFLFGQGTCNAMLTYYIFFWCSFLSVINFSESAKNSRQKRYLIYPKNGSKVQVILGTGVPVPLENQAVTIGWVIKSAYLVPTNATEILDPYVTFQKRSAGRRATRYDFYRTFENAAESFGGGGKACLLRTICEASKTPFRASGFIGQFLHIFFTPSTTDEPPIRRSDLDYHSAERLGKDPDTNCRQLYRECSYTIIDLLTVMM